MNKELTFKYYSDAGHGWIAVKRDLLKKLDIEQNISIFSYQKGETVYLEEDCDASRLIDALKINNINYKTITIHQNKSRIRNYNNYRSEPTS